MSTKIDVARVPVKEAIDPQSVAAAGTAATGWIAAKDAENFLAVIQGGALGGGSVAASFTQATDGSGTDSKALSITAPTALSVNNTQSEIDVNPNDLDLANNFTHFKMTLTVTGGTGALVAGLVQAAGLRYVG